MDQTDVQDLPQVQHFIDVLGDIGDSYIANPDQRAEMKRDILDAAVAMIESLRDDDPATGSPPRPIAWRDPTTGLLSGPIVD